LIIFFQPSIENRRKVRLAGYGVELQIKSTEYKAKDDSKVGVKYIYLNISFKIKNS
jgi:hypothetical protein